jgi:DNA-binding transcriptional ArsR family regulator
MQKTAAQASDILKSLANPHRLLILCQLVNGECSVGDLAAFLNLRSSTVSQHLALLRWDGLVLPRRVGQTVWYRIASQPARKILEILFNSRGAPSQLTDPT